MCDSRHDLGLHVGGYVCPGFACGRRRGREELFNVAWGDGREDGPIGEGGVVFFNFVYGLNGGGLELRACHAERWDCAGVQFGGAIAGRR